MDGPAEKATTGQLEEVPVGKWLAPVRAGALAVFVALPVFAYFLQPLAGRVVWTIVVASLPLFIVIAGYHHWRRVCPLAWFAQLAARLGRPGQRRASPWLQANYYSVAFSIFLICLWLRLVATNGHGKALAGFLLLLSLAALAFGAAYTGKSWCNYVCPVSFVEKIYTEPRGIRQTPSSQCEKCTACKPACPDINQENGYWKEIDSAPKRFVYFAFPGLVFSFYFYFYLQSGTWDYYFGGAWTDEPQVLHTAFLPGHDAKTAGFFFLPSAPRAVATFATLAGGALLSLALFSLIERLVRERASRRGVGMDQASVRHIMFTLAAFVAFITFYTFAGAPTIRLIPGAPHLFQILVVATATLFLARRLTRRQQAFAEEILARQVIRRWDWADVEPPKNLHDAYLIYKIRSETLASGHARLLEIYKEGVREAVASGFVSRAEVQRLESLRNQLQISQPEHEKIMADLDEEERARRTRPVLQVSAEKRLQLETYSRALQTYLERVSVAAHVPDDSFIRQLRLEYCVTPEEHGAVLNDLLGKGQGMGPHVADALGVIEGAAHTLQLLRAAPSAAGDFLADVVSRRRTRAAEGLMRGFGCGPEEEQNRPMLDGLLSDDEALRETAVVALGGSVAQAISDRLKEARREAARQAADRATVAKCVRSHLASADPYVRAAALYLLHERAGMEKEYAPGEALCVEGEPGDEVFILLSGDVQVLRRDGAEQRLVGGEKAGGFLGEMAVVDPAPRAATVLAGAQGARVLCLEGSSFRGALRTNPSVAQGVIRALAARLRGSQPTPRASNKVQSVGVAAGAASRGGKVSAD